MLPRFRVQVLLPILGAFLLACDGEERSRGMMPMMGRAPMRDMMQRMMGDMLPLGVEPEDLPEPASEGARLLSRYCSQCHAVPSPQLHTASEWRNVVDRMANRMEMLGDHPMMSVDSPSRDELDAVVAYLMSHSMQGLSPEDLPKLTGSGAEAFRQVCSGCHAVPDPGQHSAAEWPAVVERMARNMTALQRQVPEQAVLEQLVAFLQANASQR